MPVFEAVHCSVMTWAQDQGGDGGTGESPEHIPVTVKEISLGTHDGIGGNIQNFYQGKLSQFIEGTEAKTGNNDNELQHPTFFDKPAPVIHLLEEKSRKEALGEMADPVEVVALPAEDLL